MIHSAANSLKPGHISGAEAARRIAAAIAGPGIKLQEVERTGFWFISEADGQLMIQSDIFLAVKKIPFLRLGSVKPCFLRKDEIVVCCRVIQTEVPEFALNLLETLIIKSGCIMTVKHLKE